MVVVFMGRRSSLLYRFAGPGMQKYLVSLVFGLGQAASAATTPNHICNETHAVYDGSGQGVLYEAGAALPSGAGPRRCGVEPMDIYGRRTSVRWKALPAPTALCGHALCARTPVGTVAYSEGRVVLGEVVAEVRPAFEVTHVVAATADVFVAGGRCVHSISIGKTACVPDDNFTVAGIAADNDTVYVIGGEHGDVYAFHHVAAPSTVAETFTGQHMRARTWQLLPAVPAASQLNTACLPRSVGKPTGLILEGNTLHRYFESAVISSAVAPKTAATVWLPYAAANTKVCDVLPKEPCAWHEWHIESTCRARRQCASVHYLPTATENFACGRSRRQYVAPSPPPQSNPSPTQSNPSPTQNDFEVTIQNTAGSFLLSSVPVFEGLVTEDTCDPSVFQEPPARCELSPTAIECDPPPPEITLTVIDGRAVALVNLHEPEPVACGDDHFARSGQCLPCEKCARGTYLESDCTPTSDVICAACRRGTYQPAQWHTETACHTSNGCPGGDRTKNGICESTSFNYNTLWAMALPLYGGVVMVLKT